MVDALGNALQLVLTGGEQADCPQLPLLLAALPHHPSQVVADKAYDTEKMLASIGLHQAETVIPPKATRLDQRRYDENLCADRNEVERFWPWLKVWYKS